ncbi:MAG: Tol biopolymer transport system component [Bacteroidia bacterium]|jgi:Tol biopolymer transport system component
MTNLWCRFTYIGQSSTIPIKKYMKKLLPLLSLAFLFLLPPNVIADLGKDPDPIKMALARNKFKEGDFHGALRVYRDLYQVHKEHDLLNFRMGECYLSLEESDKAVNYFKDAMKINPSVDLLLGYYLGMAYRQKKDEAEAIKWLDQYLAQPKLKKADKADGQSLRDKCANTIDYMKNPVNVTIESASDNINTSNHEYHPSITADGKIMVFTSRRSDTKGGGTDQFDGDFYEDVYITYWDEKANDWSPAKPIPGKVNGPEHDACLSIAPDGRKLFIYRNTNAGDIYMAKSRPSQEARDAVSDGLPEQHQLLSESMWSTPKDLSKPVNSSYWDSYGSINADGNMLYFSSERPDKAFGNGDIYTAKAKTRTEWLKPKNLGPNINSIEDEKGVFIHPDGKTLFFASKGHSTMGGYDIFRSVKDSKGNWGSPENLGYPINTRGDEFDFVVTTDGSSAYYCAKSDTSDKFDIFRVDLANYNVVGEGTLSEASKGLALLKGRITNNKDEAVGTSVTLLETNGGALVKTVETDAEGNYLLAVEGGKSYQLVINAKGYNEYSKEVELEAKEDGVASKDLDVILVADE